MSVKRSPPNHMLPNTNLHHTEYIDGGSDPQLNEMGNLRMNSMRSIKRKPDFDKEELVAAILPELTAVLHSFEERQSARIDALVSTLTAQNMEIQKSVEFVSMKYDEQLLKIEQLMNNQSLNEKKIEELQAKVDELESGRRHSMVEIRNIPRQESENKEILTNIVKEIGNKIKQPILDSDIRDLYRVKTKNELSNHIVVDFIRTGLKVSVIKKCRTFNRDNGNDRFNTTHIGLSGKKNQIYIDEALTKRASRLFYLTRKFVKEHNQYNCWTSYGKVYIKENNKEKAKVLCIHSENDLKLLSK